jgi:hypothetical protein
MCQQNVSVILVGQSLSGDISEYQLEYLLYLPNYSEEQLQRIIIQKHSKRLDFYFEQQKRDGFDLSQAQAHLTQVFSKVVEIVPKVYSMGMVSSDEIYAMLMSIWRRLYGEAFPTSCSDIIQAYRRMQEEQEEEELETKDQVDLQAMLPMPKTSEVKIAFDELMSFPVFNVSTVGQSQVAIVKRDLNNPLESTDSARPLSSRGKADLRG